MQGAFSLAWRNRSRTREAPTPTNISTKSLPLMLKNGTSASPAMALASRVLPQPGSPTSSTPRGMRPPSRWKRLGFLRNSTISTTSSLASSMPATSSKVTCVCSLVVMRWRLRPTLPSIPAPPALWRSCRMNRNQMTPKKISHGIIGSRNVSSRLLLRLSQMTTGRGESFWMCSCQSICCWPTADQRTCTRLVRALTGGLRSSATIRSSERISMLLTWPSRR